MGRLHLPEGSQLRQRPAVGFAVSEVAGLVRVCALADRYMSINGIYRTSARSGRLIKRTAGQIRLFDQCALEVGCRRRRCSRHPPGVGLSGHDDAGFRVFA